MSWGKSKFLYSQKQENATSVEISRTNGQIFQLALQSYKSGNLLQAEQLCKQILQGDSDNAEANHFLGVIALKQGGKHDTAIYYIRKAIQTHPNNFVFHNNLGLVFKSSGKMEEAIASFSTALSLKPDYVEAHINLGVVFDETGMLDDAFACNRKALSLNPNIAQAHNNLGNIFQKQGKIDEAIASFKKALAINPGFAEGHNNLGYVFFESGRLDDAISSYRKALAINPNIAKVHNNLSNVFQKQGKIDEAIASYRKAIIVNPDYAEAHASLGVMLQKLNKIDDAIASYRKALSIDPNIAVAHNNIGVVLQKSQKMEEARACYLKALAISPDYAEAHVNLSYVYKELGMMDKAFASNMTALAINPDYADAHNNLGVLFQTSNKLGEAIASFKKALSINPDHADAHANLGDIFQEQGKMDEAIANYRKALSINQEFVKPTCGLSRIVKYSKYNNFIKKTEDLYAKKDISDEDKTFLGFALGKLFEGLKEYDKAFDFFLGANQLRRKVFKYSIQMHHYFFGKIKNTFSPDFFSSDHGPGNQNNTPIFVLGMPRSGTTLIEQILASHPQVFGAGELEILGKLVQSNCYGLTTKKFPECVAELDADIFKRMGSDYMEGLREYSKDAQYITDKMPHNFLYVGLIKTILPQAKVIHCIRNPMDNCLSIFKSLFRVHETHGYSYDLVELGQYHNLYRSLMDHWEKVLPGHMYNLRYEDMVSDQENQTRKILEFCGLPWDKACLEFHKLERSIKTLSVAQVRQPIYKDSVELWKRYEKKLEPLRKVIYGE